MRIHRTESPERARLEVDRKTAAVALVDQATLLVDILYVRPRSGQPFVVLPRDLDRFIHNLRMVSAYVQSKLDVAPVRNVLMRLHPSGRKALEHAQAAGGHLQEGRVDETRAELTELTRVVETAATRPSTQDVLDPTARSGATAVDLQATSRAGASLFGDAITGAAQGPRFASQAELQRFCEAKNLRRELDAWRVDEPANLPASLRPLRETLFFLHGKENVSIYRVPVGDGVRFVVECAARPEPLLGIYSDKELVAAAHRPRTAFAWEGPARTPGWAKQMKALADENLQQLRAQAALRPDELPAPVQAAAAQRAPANVTWFGVPGSSGQGFCAQWVADGASHVRLLNAQGELLAAGTRPFSTYLFDGQASLPSPSSAAA